MNKKHLLEFTLLAAFVLFGLSPLFKLGVPYATIITLVSGGLLSMLYFYAAFWLFSASIPIAIRIIAGLAYSESIVAWMFCLLHWPYWKLFDVVSYILLAVILISCLFNRKSPVYKPLFYRCIFFMITLSALYGYRHFAG